MRGFPIKPARGMVAVAAVGLVLAGLAARGQTIVNRVYHLDRGYQRMERTLQALGADIQRIEEAAV